MKMDTKKETVKEFVDRVLSEVKTDIPPIEDNRTQEEKDIDLLRFMSEPMFPNYTKKKFKQVFDFVHKER